MSKIVKHNEFKKVVNALWDKSKEVYEHIWDMCTYLEKDKASLSKDNVFVGKNTFNEVMLTGKTVFNQTSTIPDSVIYGAGRYCGYRVISTHNNAPTPLTPKYVSAIKIRVLDDLNVGDIVDGVHVVEVEKKADKLNDIVGKTIADGSSFIVEEDAEYQRCIYVPVEKEYSNDTYFLIAQSGTGQFRQIRFDHLPNHVQESINGLVIEQLPAEGQPLNHDRGVGWAVLHGLTTNTIDVRETVNSINNKVDRSEVGNSAGKIPQIDGSGKLETSIMPDLAITDVHIVANEQEMMNLNVQKGDVVVVENGPQHQNQTFMCKNHTATTQNDKFIAINMGYPVVKKINNIFPDQVGAMTLNATHIDCTINNDTKSTQVHLSNIGNGLRNVDQRVTNNTNRISALENRKLTVQAGDIITTIKNNGAAYTVGGATFLHCGIRKTISRAQYPQLADALGIPTGTNNFEYPYIQDANLNYDNGQRNATRRTYICAHVR